VDYEWIKGRFAPGMMTKPGMTVSRWIDGVLTPNDMIDQGPNLRAHIFWGHAPNSQTRGLDMKKAMNKLDLLVVIDPYPSATAAMAAMPSDDAPLNPKRAVYLLPATTQFETSGSVTASNRSLQWREKVVEPMFESRTDHMIMAQLADKLGFGKELVKNYKMVPGKGGMMEPETESILREINRGVWTIGYTGQSPERLKAHSAQYARVRRQDSARPRRHRQGNRLQTRRRILRPALALLRHAGVAPSGHGESVRHLAQCHGRRRQLPRQLRRRTRRQSLLAADGSASKGADIQTGYPEFDSTLLKKLGWWNELTDAEKKLADGKNWKTDQSGGIIRVVMKNHSCHPFGNARARAVVWNFPDPIPQHREPLFSVRPDMVVKYPTYDDKKTFWRLPTLYKTVQDKNIDIVKKFPLILTSGRLVEYEGGGDETRSNPWLAELQQFAFVQVNPAVPTTATSVKGMTSG
jgi:Anaerobic dehydrogenases, typically selenocysteine-containing